MSSTIFKTKQFPPGNFPLQLVGIIAGSIVGGGLLFAAYLFISRATVYNSDDASIILQAESMLHGNAILRGWYLPTDNWLTLEIPLYTLGLLLGFSTTSLLHVIPAFLYTLVVIAGGYLASMLLQGKQRAWCWLAFLGIAAFPALDMAQRLLVGPTHISTILFTLLGLIAYKYSLAGKKDKRAAFACVLVLMVLMIIGDPFALVLFVLPLILTEGSQMLVTRRLAWRENFKLYSVILAIILSFCLRKITDLAGVHNMVTAGFLLQSISGIAGNFVSALHSMLVIFHANVLAQNPLSNLPLLLNALLLIVLIYAAVRWSIRSLLHPMTDMTKVISVLIWGSIGILASFTLSRLGGDTGMRYLYPLLFFGGVISFPVMRSFVQRYALMSLVILTFLTNITAFTISCYQAPAAVAPEAQLITLLHEKHLTHGLGTYWVSPIVTVQSEKQIVLRQILMTHDRIHPFYFLADQEWFNRASLQSANFIVYMNSDNSEAYYRASLQSFGPPNHQYRTGVYTVLTWDAPLLTHMQPGYSFWTP